jgi:hypothetical protein
MLLYSGQNAILKYWGDQIVSTIVSQTSHGKKRLARGILPAVPRITKFAPLCCRYDDLKSIEVTYYLLDILVSNLKIKELPRI